MMIDIEIILLLEQKLNQINSLGIDDENEFYPYFYKSILHLVTIESFGNRIYSKSKRNKLGNTGIFDLVIQEHSDWEFKNKASLFLLHRDNELMKFRAARSAIPKMDIRFQTFSNIISNAEELDLNLPILQKYSDSGPIKKIIRRYKYTNLLYSLRSSLVHELNGEDKKSIVNWSDPFNESKPNYATSSEVIKIKGKSQIGNEKYKLFFPMNTGEVILKSIINKNKLRLSQVSHPIPY